MILVRLLVVAVAVAAASPVQEFGAGGRGLASAKHLNYESVMSCLFELADINHNGRLEELELRLVMDRYVTKAEQLYDGLSPSRIIAACDTDRSMAVNWTEALELPRCLTTAQVEGIAKWVCSRAKHSDFSFDEYLAAAVHIQQGFIEGNGLKTIASEMMRALAAQNDARAAFLARQAGVPRLSSTVNDLLLGIRKPASVIALVWAFPLLVIALVVACL